jgi:hypothetical protein
VAGYRFRPTLRHRWGGYLAIVVLVGLVGGLAMASIAGARRTQSSYPNFLASTNPSNLSFGTALLNPNLGYTSGYDGATIRRVAALPGVTRAESYVNSFGVPLGPGGKPTPAAANSNLTIEILGSVDGEYFDMDRAAVVAGRMSNPSHPDEIVATEGAARGLGLRLGQRVPWGFYSDAQTAAAATGNPPVPAVHVDLTLVGIVVLNNAVVQDDADVANDQSVILTPALTNHLLGCCADFTFTYLQLRHHAAGVPTVEHEVERVIPSTLPYDFYDPTVEVAKALHSTKPEAIAVGVFGLVAALATLLIGAQLIGRQLRSSAGEERVLRSLGASPVAIMADSLAGLVGAVVVGALGAGVVAVGLSPLFPLGPVRPVYPYGGVSFDWTVLGLGVLALIVLLGAAACALAWRVAPHRVAAGGNAVIGVRQSKAASAAGRWGMSVPAVTGVRFALEPGSDGAPVRSAILGAILALIVVVTTVVFGSSLNALVASPVQYGWNWAYQLNAGGGVGDLPQASADRLLAADGQVAAWSSYYFGNLQIDGRTVPTLGATPNEAVGPPVLSGHGFDGRGQIILGTETLRGLHKRVGDSVEVAYGATRPTPLRIVGTETLPAIGVAGVTGHLSMGTGAEADYHLIPASVRNSFGNLPAGPNSVFVRLRPGVSLPSARSGLSHIATELSLPTNYGVTLAGVQRPAEIVNYRSMGATPAVLGLTLASGAVVALGLTLVSSVRRRRRDLAVLKTFGLSGRQLAQSVAWQAGVAVGIGVIVGIPCGIVAGRWLWTRFAESIYVVPEPAVPAVWIVAIGLAALVLGVVVAAVPGRIASRTPTALLLRAE